MKTTLAAGQVAASAKRAGAQNTHAAALPAFTGAASSGHHPHYTAFRTERGWAFTTPAGLDDGHRLKVAAQARANALKSADPHGDVWTPPAEPRGRQKTRSAKRKAAPQKAGVIPPRCGAVLSVRLLDAEFAERVDRAAAGTGVAPEDLARVGLGRVCDEFERTGQERCGPAAAPEAPRKAHSAKRKAPARKVAVKPGPRAIDDLSAARAELATTADALRQAMQLGKDLKAAHDAFNAAMSRYREKHDSPLPEGIVPARWVDLGADMGMVLNQFLARMRDRPPVTCEALLAILTACMSHAEGLALEAWGESAGKVARWLRNIDGLGWRMDHPPRPPMRSQSSGELPPTNRRGIAEWATLQKLLTAEEWQIMAACSPASRAAEEWLRLKEECTPEEWLAILRGGETPEQVSKLPLPLEGLEFGWQWLTMAPARIRRRLGKRYASRLSEPVQRLLSASKPAALVSAHDNVSAAAGTGRERRKP